MFFCCLRQVAASPLAHFSLFSAVDFSEKWGIMGAQLEILSGVAGRISFELRQQKTEIASANDDFLHNQPGDRVESRRN
jgi:hypothetical protein